jgi:hypothetical protein
MVRRWETPIMIAFLAGLLLYGFFCYRVLMAGGLSATSIRPTCSKAAIGSETRDYRAGESVHIRRSYLPPTAICQWSGGTTAALIPANALSWAGPVLIAASVLAGLSMKAGDAAWKRNRRKQVS